MKRNLFKTKVLVWMLLMVSLLGNYTFGQTQTIVEFTSGSGSWTIPADAISIDIEVWGNGGTSSSIFGAGGGGYVGAFGIPRGNIGAISYAFGVGMGTTLDPRRNDVRLINGQLIGYLTGYYGLSSTTGGTGSQNVEAFFVPTNIIIETGGNGTGAGKGGKGGGVGGGVGGNGPGVSGTAPGGGSGGINTAPNSPFGAGGAGLVRITYTSGPPPSITTTFNQVAPICKGGTLAALPTTSTNMPTGITGTWAPAINNMATTTYTFTPAPGQDASTATMTILVVAPPAPIPTTPQAFCPDQKIADLVANGTALKWYSTLTGGSELPPTDVLTATTYYVSQYDGACESDRTPVLVNFNSVPSVTATIATAATACNIGSITITPFRTTDDTVLIDETFNTTNSNWSIYKDAFHETGGQNFVKLTKDENGKNGQLLFAKTSAAPKAFEMSFQAFMLNKSGADGFSVNYGEIGDVQSLQEEGNGTGLVLRFKTYNQDRIQLVYNGSQIGGDYNLTLEDGSWHTYTVTVTENGSISLKRDGNPIFSNVTIPSYTTTANFQWAFAGRTGGEKNEHIIDAIKFTDKTPFQFSYDQTNWQLANTFSNVPAGSRTVYARRGNAGCTKSLGAINVVGTPPPTPTFTQIAPICKGATLSPLPTTSTNNYAGTWAPALDNMTTTTYTFTPDAGVCANTATMTIVVNEPVSPTFSGNTIVLDKKNSSSPNFGTLTINNQATYRIELWSKGGVANNSASSDNSGGDGGGYTGAETLLAADFYDYGLNNTSAYFGNSIGSIEMAAFAPSVSSGPGTGRGGTKNIMGGFGFLQGGGGAAGWWGHNGASLDGTSTAGGDSGTPDNSSDGGYSTSSGEFPGGGGGSGDGDGAEGRILITKIEPLITTYCKGAIITPLPTTSAEGITGTWAPDLDNQTTTLYTFTPTAGQCANTTTLTITVNDPTTVPTFVQVAPICNGAPLAALPTTSTNNVKGTWSPSLMNNQTTTTYTFTPSAGECASTATMEIVVNYTNKPTANGNQRFCAGSTVADLVATGTDIKWYSLFVTQTTLLDPSTTLSIGNYYATQTVNGCESGATGYAIVSVTISPILSPTFTQVAPICKGASLAALPTISTNSPLAVTGTWDPVMNNQTTTTYTFTPTAGQCANSTTMQIVVNETVVPTFTQIAPICKGAPLAALSTFSIQGTSGIWAPVINNQTTTTYTYTPDAGQCTSGTASMTIVVKAAVPLPVVPSGQNGFLVSAEGNTIGTCPDYRGIYASPQLMGPNVIYGNQSISAFSLVLNGGLWSIFINDGSGNQQIFTNPMPGSVPPVSGWVRSPIFACTDNSITVATIKSLSFCEGATVFNLKQAFDNGNNVKFYDGSNALIYTSNATVLTSGDVFATQTIDGCESAKLQVQITIKPIATPSFSQLGPICKGASFSLPPFSDNNIPGSWSPSFNNQASGTYTFTPTAGQCATTASMTVVVNDLPAAPTANQRQTFCSGNTVADLVATGTNIKWYTLSPSQTLLAPTTALSIGTYFASQTVTGCESELTAVIVIVDPNVPTFAQIAPICKGASLAALPTVSTNTVGITGTWSPSIMNNMATTTYTFTPNAGQCASTVTMEITVNNCSVISGTVLEDADAGTMDGTPVTVSNAYLSIFRVGDGGGRLSFDTPPVSPPLHVVPIINGAYAFPILAEGKYKIVIGTSAVGSETASYPNVGNFSMTSSAEGEAGTAGDGTPDGITFVTIYEGNPPVYSGSRVRADAGISFAIKQLAPLPVRLISFTGKNTENGNELSWKTSSEVNFSHFEVEKSSDAKKFENIGKVAGNKGENYDFTDKNSSFITNHSSLNFYRLKMVDLDGSFAYSKIIALNSKNTGNSIGQIYPNPTISEAQIIVKVKESGTWTIKTFDITGKLISNEITNLLGGENKIELKKLGTGMNYIQMTNGKIKEVRKVLKQ